MDDEALRVRRAFDATPPSNQPRVMGAEAWVP